MTRLSIFLSFAKAKLFFLLVCFALAAFGCVSLNATAFARSDRWIGCRGADLVLRIAGCTEVIARVSRETKPNQIMAYINRGTAYRAKGDFDHALADLDKALQLDPKSTRALTERAYSKGEFDRAIADYDVVISAQSQSPAVFYGRGEAYRAKNDLDRAIADYDRALQLDKNLATAYGGSSICRGLRYRHLHVPGSLLGERHLPRRCNAPPDGRASSEATSPHLVLRREPRPAVASDRDQQGIHNILRRSQARALDRLAEFYLFRDGSWALCSARF